MKTVIRQSSPVITVDSETARANPSVGAAK
jgi:hypothetical protein